MLLNLLSADYLQVGSGIWVESKSLEASTHEKVVDMFNEGMSQKEIAEILEINKATVSKHIKRGNNGEVSKIEDI